MTNSYFYNSEASGNYGGFLYASNMNNMTFSNNYVSGSSAQEGQIMALVGSTIRAFVSSNSFYCNSGYNYDTIYNTYIVNYNYSGNNAAFFI